MMGTKSWYTCGALAAVSLQMEAGAWRNREPQGSPTACSAHSHQGQKDDADGLRCGVPMRRGTQEVPVRPAPCACQDAQEQQQQQASQAHVCCFHQTLPACMQGAQSLHPNCTCSAKAPTPLPVRRSDTSTRPTAAGRRRRL